MRNTIVALLFTFLYYSTEWLLLHYFSLSVKFNRRRKTKEVRSFRRYWIAGGCMLFVSKYRVYTVLWQFRAKCFFRSFYNIKMFMIAVFIIVSFAQHKQLQMHNIINILPFDFYFAHIISKKNEEILQGKINWKTQKKR